MDYLTTHTSLSPIRRGFAPGFVNYKKGCNGLAATSDKVYQFLAHGRWFYPGTPASSTIKTGRHEIAEILLKVALSTIKSIKQSTIFFFLGYIGVVVATIAVVSLILSLGVFLFCIRKQHTGEFFLIITARCFQVWYNFQLYQLTFYITIYRIRDVHVNHYIVDEV